MFHKDQGEETSPLNPSLERTRRIWVVKESRSCANTLEVPQEAKQSCYVTCNSTPRNTLKRNETVQTLIAALVTIAKNAATTQTCTS